MRTFTLADGLGTSSLEQWRDYVHADQSRIATAIDRSAAMARNNAIAQGIGAVVMHENMVKVVNGASNNVVSALANTNAKIEWGVDVTVAAIHEMREDSAVFYSQVTAGLNAVVESIDRVHLSILRLHAMLDHRTQVIIDKLTLTNELLENISVKLMIPDFQKERVYFIQQGLKHYRNASRNPELNLDALDNLLKAEEREITDCLVLYYIGMLYLYGKLVLDPVKAEGYFVRAAKYAAAEGRDSATAVDHNLGSFVSPEKLSEEEGRNYRKRRARQLAVNTWIEASVAAYAQGKLDAAVEYGKKAHQSDRRHARAGLQYLKCLCALGDTETAHKLLRRMLDESLLLAVPMTTDEDIMHTQGVKEIFVQYRDRAAEKLKSAIADLFTEHGPLLESDEVTGPLLATVRRSLDENTLCSMAVAAEDMSPLIEALPRRTIKWRQMNKERERQIATFKKWLAQFETWNAGIAPGYVHADEMQRHTATMRAVVADPDNLDGDALRAANLFMMKAPVVDLTRYRALFDESDTDLGPSLVPDYELMNLTGEQTALERIKWMEKVRDALLGPVTVMNHIEASKIMALLASRAPAVRQKHYDNGVRELAGQDKKWFRKNYTRALELLRLADRLGHPEAARLLEQHAHRA